MLITFKSKASQNLTMLEDLATHLLGIIGKKLGERGVISEEETAGAIAKLEAAIAEDRAAADKESENKDSDEREKDDRMRLAQRAFPLLDMLREAHKAHVAVMWGV
ncbi:hypothetical protein PTE30175_04380 [Pandoraea terrae]|uniref:DUF1840 domain-containing protein n=1 Tax=Pandoraea terrae TaxID=1537710 RepID=A0A5E4YG17_9BURK|nr:DUF1840 domain-containing protein [Pandoraea terrae]VVE47348.1 hypothetical protein PTE30175_04380 [Pandoraea terrae]